MVCGMENSYEKCITFVVPYYNSQDYMKMYFLTLLEWFIKRMEVMVLE